MDQETLNNHYRNISKKYDVNFAKDTAKKESNAKFDFSGEKGAKYICELLEINENDSVVDLGAGTCKTAGIIAKLVGLKKPLLCVDPVHEMLEIAEKSNVENIDTLVATAEDFAKKDLKYDKILIKGAVHHFPINKIREIFTGIKKQLNKGGQILIVKTGANRKGGMPYFKKGIDYHNRTHDGLTELIENLLNELGFKVDKKILEDDLEVTKEQAIKLIEDRTLSLLSAFTDEELSEGIEEVKRNHGDVIKYKAIWEMITAKVN